MTKTYLNLVRKVLKSPFTDNRTKIRTRSVFGEQLRFNLRDGTLPIITTKPVNFNMIAKELFWFMRGQTNQKILENDGVRIWKANSEREYLDSRGLTEYKEHEELGPIYGHQWRHYGAKYTNCHADYTGLGVDQLLNCINMIKNEPTSRRILMNSWDPRALDKMALPPCHIMLHFHVSHDNLLSGLVYQRSADLMLGVPFNITSYALLIHIVAKMCGLKTGELVHTFGDVHIYENHLDGANEQLTRKPFKHPKLELDIDCNLSPDEIIKNLNCSQLKLINHAYNRNPIVLKMAV